MEVVALCEGFISVDGNKQSQSSTIRHPQKHSIVANDLDIVIDMEQTSQLEVTVFDDNKQLLKDDRVSTWPNVSWGDWYSTVFCSDLYNTIDRLRQVSEDQDNIMRDMPAGFYGISDSNGLAVLSNLSAGKISFTVEHRDYVLPKVEITGSSSRRQADIILEPGTITRTKVILEPKNKDPQNHY